jgi:hypothetical protein
VRQLNYWFQRAKEITVEKSFGGETCPAGGNERWRDCNNMVGSTNVESEPEALHMNYLFREWAEGAKRAWIDGGCYEEIKNRLGYRFELRQVDYPTEVTAGQTFTVTAHIMNTGWARLHKPRRAQLFLVKELAELEKWPAPTPIPAADGTGATQSWVPSSAQHRVVFTGSIPTAGRYKLHLAIFDPDAAVIWNKPPKRIGERDEWPYHYAVKLATKRNGELLFKQLTGMNDLGLFINVR